MRLWRHWLGWNRRMRTILVVCILGPLTGFIAAVLLPPDVMQFRSFIVGMVVGMLMSLGIFVVILAAITEPPKLREKP